jgi:asparagine synthase (glutamine-hydrolysing)
VEIVVSGLGADSIVAGERKFVRTYLRELWKKKKIGKFIKELVGSSDWILSYLIWSFLFGKKAELKVKMLLAPQFVETLSKGEMQKEDASLQDALLHNITCTRASSKESLRVYHRASTAFSLDSRHPFLDHKIIEFAFSLPTTQKIRNGWTKYILRNAMKGLIPEVIRRKRKKLGAPIPQQRWMRELQQNIRKLFESKKFQERKYFNQPAILEVFNRYCEGKLNRLEREYYTDVLWRIINLELWLELYFDEE